jgi:hypothetical protein
MKNKVQKKKAPACKSDKQELHKKPCKPSKLKGGKKY